MRRGLFLVLLVVLTLRLMGGAAAQENRPEAWRQRLDENKDGRVDRDELRRGRGGVATARNARAADQRTTAGLATQSTSNDAGTSIGITMERCRLAADYSEKFKGISFVVMHEGKIIFEDYPNGGSPERAWELASGTKSFAGVVAVAAAADGLLTLDEPVSKTITEWQGDPRKAKITIRQLLQLTAGLETGGEQGKVPLYADAIEKPMATAPGEKFKYGAVPFQVFGEMMRRKLAPQKLDYLGYLQQRILDPIGIQPRRWRRDAAGQPNIPSGAAFTARDWATYDDLIRLGGAWQGRQILPGELLDQCFLGTAANPAYGLTWWLRRPIDETLRQTIPELNFATDITAESASLPGDLVVAAGAGKQRLYISRQHKLVVVRQATGILESLQKFDQNGFSDQAFLSLLLTGKARAREQAL